MRVLASRAFEQESSSAICTFQQVPPGAPSIERIGGVSPVPEGFDRAAHHPACRIVLDINSAHSNYAHRHESAPPRAGMGVGATLQSRSSNPDIYHQLY